ncbi:MAG TPA: type II toxin-antitoxin system VapC family toxin [Candidatus Limnocylindrales bacterium]|nr:type II toxin-antitoxin system VapC family toxin [Candidatus Limnocylindrales bacterium]
MADVVIDTDVASVLQKDRAPAWVGRHIAGKRVWLSFVAVGELWKWAEVRSWGAKTRSSLDDWIAARPIVPYDTEVARSWARLSAGAQRRGRPTPQNDTWVAACCVRHNLPLLTLNKKDFEGFARHDGLVLLGEDD